MTKAKSRFSFIADRAMHIGQQIKLILEERGISAIEFAAMIHCNRSNVYDIFQRKSIDTQRLKIISKALQHDFFIDLSKDCFPLSESTISIKWGPQQYIITND